jgi:hypothetical protein
MKILKLLILIFIVSYSLMFWFFYLNDFAIGLNLFSYFKDCITHIETLSIFPASFFLYKTLQLNF